MTCDDATAQFDLLDDGELGREAADALATHLAGCARCAAALARHRATAQTIRDGLTRYPAPPHLEAAVRTMLAGERRPRMPAAARWRPLAIAAALLVAVGAGAGVGYSRGTADSAVTDALVTSHIRSLLADHLTDVVSSDRHTVKPWLDSRLDYAPPVIDLTTEGFPLVGGRLDYLAGHRVAVLVARRGQHAINTYVAPEGSFAGVRDGIAAKRGYHVVRWRAGGMDFVAISDVARDDLARFAAQMQARLGAEGAAP